MIINKSFFLFFFLSLLIASLVSAQAGDVLTVEITGTIDEAQSELLQGAIQEAENRNVEALLVLLDTPGGGVTQTFAMADFIQASTVPVVGFVYPRGAAAWSAGTLLLISTHVAAMADNTIIGSAQPVYLSPLGTQPVNDSKTINALVEWTQERARMYHRNATVAKQFITENLNLNATRALQLGVIEITASSLDDLLSQLNGMNVSLSEGNVTLNTLNAEVEQFSPSLKFHILRLVSNPVLSSLLLIIGLLSLFLGLQAPGFGAEVFGVIAIILSLVGSGFGISTIGSIFLLIGIVLLIIEVFVVPGFGFIGVGGLIALIMGSIFLIPTYPSHGWLITMDYIQQAIIIIVFVAVLVAVFFGFLLYKFLEIRKKKKSTGVFVGEEAKTIDRITPDSPGYVRFKGEYWQARADTIIEPKTKVIIVGKDDATLVVKPKTTNSS